VRSHPQPDLDLTYVKRSGESNGDAGDKYIGLDRFGRVVDQRWVIASTGTATDRFQYGYDRAGNRLYRDNRINSAFGEVYTYDGLNQLASFARGTLNGGKTAVTGTPAREQVWDYDAVGNWDGIDVDGVTESRTANAQNEITDIGSLTTPTYDANGNMTGDEAVRVLVYDAWNRLVRVDAASVTVVSYSYDGLNRRVTRDDGATTDLYYSAGWQVVEEGVGGDVAARQVWSPVYVDALVLRDRDTDADGVPDDERLWVQQDANWNVTAIVDGNGVVGERFVYEAFGAATVYSPTWGTVRTSSSYDWEYTHQGGRLDTISGHVNYRNRDYSPDLGRWTSPDPIRYDCSDANLSRYNSNNPVVVIDPNGLQGIYSSWVNIRSLDSGLIPREWVKPGRGSAGMDFFHVRGSRGYWTGRFTQPASAATEVDWGRLPTGAFMLLELTGNGEPGGVCNTPWSSTDPPRRSDLAWLAHGGSLKASLRDFCAGTYEVEMSFSISITTKAQGGVTSSVGVFTPNRDGDLANQFGDNYRANAQGNVGAVVRGQNKTVVRVVVGESGSADVLGMKLNTAGSTGAISTRMELTVNWNTLKKV